MTWQEEVAAIPEERLKSDPLMKRLVMWVVSLFV